MSKNDEREDEVQALLDKMYDIDDLYDGHHADSDDGDDEVDD